MKTIIKIMVLMAVFIAPSSAMPLFRLPLEFTQTESCAQLDLLSVAKTKDMPWVIVKVQPNRLSGVSVIGDPTARPIIQTCNAYGTYEVVGQLGAPVSQKVENYSWPVLVSFGGQRSQVTDERYGQFSSTFGNRPRYFLCQLNEGAKGNDLFTSVNLIPDEWVGFAAPAVDFIRLHPILQSAYGSTVRSNQASDLIKDKNPFLVLTAAQILTSEGKFLASDMKTVLGSENAVLIAAVAADSNIGYFQGSLGTVGYIDPKTVQAASIAQLEGLVVGVSVAQYVFTDVTMYKGTQPLTTVGNGYGKRYDALHNFAHQVYSSATLRLPQLDQPAGADPRSDVISKFCLYFGDINTKTAQQ